MGYDWEAGPSADQYYDLTIMSVGSMQMAIQLKENDPVSQQGLFYDHHYFEWSIFMPFSKVSPTYRETLKKLLIKAGVELNDNYPYISNKRKHSNEILIEERRE